MKQIILFIIILGIHHIDAIACSCIEPKPFCEQAADFVEWNPENVIIVRGQVTNIVRAQHRRDLIIEIRESFHNPPNIKKIRIKEGNGADCGHSLENYRKGDELIFMTNIYEDEGTMGLFSICSAGPLIVNRNRVKGSITGLYEEEMSLNAFRNLICIPSSDYISFYPNPTSDQIQIVASEISATSSLEIYLVNTMGQCVLQYEPTAEEKNIGLWTIPVQQLPEGTYFLHVIGPNVRRQISAVMVMR